MEQVEILSNGKFGSFVPKPKKRKEIQERTIPESFQHSIGQSKKNKKALDEIIQRLIAIEMRKHRDKERISIKRTYSDSETILHKNKIKRQTIHLNPLKLNLGRGNQSKSYLQMERSEKTNELTNNVGKNATFRDETVEELEENDEADKAKEVEILRAETETAENVDSIPHEQKLDSHNAEIPVGDVKDLSLSNNETDKKEIRDQKDNSSQTEHCYLIRTSQSCPLKKKQSTSYPQMHFDQTMNFKERLKNPSILDFSNKNLFIYRKASDNLIYEKRKGRNSPSYISSPERFQWKYISPRCERKNTFCHG